MNRQTMHLPALIAGLCLFLLSSCIKPPKDFDPRNADNVYTGCRIQQTIFQRSSTTQSFFYTRKFRYNRNGDPVAASFGNFTGGGTGIPDLSFTYDNKNRLIEFAGLYTNGYYEYLHRYTYDKDRIVIDSEYNFGLYGGPLPDKSAYHYFSYDNFGRIILDSLVYHGYNIGPVLYHYSYDLNGNLVDGTKLYDNKMNPRRTNKVWMFIDRNYSVNNPSAAVSYNSSGLPLKINVPGDFLRFFYGAVTDFTYECR